MACGRHIAVRRQVWVGGFDEEMVVIPHEAIGMAYPVVAVNGVGKNAEKGAAVGIVKKDRRLRIATGSEMIDRPGKFKS